MGRLSYLVGLTLVLLLLHGHSGRAGRSSSRSKTSSSSRSSGSSSSSSKSTGSGHKTSYGTKTKPGSSSHNPTQHRPGHDYPHQLPKQNPAAGGYPKQNPAAGGYPNQNPAVGGYPNQNPSAGGYPNQNPAVGDYPKQNPSAGGYPNQNPAVGGYPKQNPSAGGYPNQNPAAGGYPKQNPAAGGYPNQNPAVGGYPNQNPSAGGYPNQNPAVGDYPKQNPSAGGYPNQNPAVGGYPKQNPSAGGYPNQNPAAGGYPNQYPAAGGYPNQNPSAGGYPNQYPAAGGYPKQNPAAGGYPNQYPAAGGYPNQYPAAGGYPNQYPAVGGYPNQYPAAGGYPNQYPAAGGYPNHYPGTGGFSPGGYPKQYPAAGNFPGGGAAYPSDKILSPRYGWSDGYSARGVGGSPFSRQVQSKGLFPSETSKGFAKKAAVAAGLGGMAGAAVGYGVGRYSSPDFGFRKPTEEQFYNYYMYNRHDTVPNHHDRHHKPNRKSGKGKHYSKNDLSQNNPRQTNASPNQYFENFMENCMKRTDLLKEKHNGSHWQGTNGAGSQGVKPRPTGEPKAQEDLLSRGIGTENFEIPAPGNGSINVTSTEGGTLDIPKKERSLARPASPLEGDNDTVSILEIGYPELIEQLKIRRCVEMFTVYEAQQQKSLNAGSGEMSSGSKVQQHPLCHGVVLLFTSALVVLSSAVLLN